MRVVSSRARRWAPWVLASVPAVAVIVLPTEDFRASGAMTLFAATPAATFFLLVIRRPWRAERRSLRLLGLAGLLALGLMFTVAAVEGTPSFLREQFGLFISADDYGPRAVIATPAGFVVVGDDTDRNAVVWLSDDAMTWSRVLPSDVLSGLAIGDAALTPFGIVMVAQDEKTGKPVVLTSTDGAQWVRAASLEPSAVPRALAFSGTDLVLIGSTYRNDTVFWHGDGMSTWTVAAPAPVQDRGKSPVDVAAVGSGFVTAQYSDKLDSGAVLFASESGRSWTQIAHFRDGEFSSLAAYRGGAVAVGFDGSTDSAAVWVSTGGGMWTQAPTSNAFERARMDVVATDGERLFAFGRSLDGDGGVVWSSVDAMTWERIPASFGDVLFRDAIVTESRIVAVGLDLASETAAFWTSEDGDAWRRVPHDNALFSVR